MTKLISEATRGWAADNLIINGGMDISQEVGTTQTTLTNNTAKYGVDQWIVQYNHAAATAVLKHQQVAPPGSPSFGAAYGSCLQLTATTAISSPAAGDFGLFYYPIEGYRCAQLAYGAAGGRDITIGFWVYATITGTMGVVVKNGASNRSYPTNVTINSATTWEYKTVTIPADTTGTWAKDNTVGMYIQFCCVTGSTFQGTAGAWSASNLLGTSSQTNFFATANNTVCITGVGVWPAGFAPSAAMSPVAKRPFDEELQLCQRYYEKSYPYGNAPGSTGGGLLGTQGFAIDGLASATHAFLMSTAWRVRKRTTPTVTCYGYSTGTSGQITDAVTAGDLTATIDNISDSSARIYSTSVSASGTVSRYFQWVANARM